MFEKLYMKLNPSFHLQNAVSNIVLDPLNFFDINNNDVEATDDFQYWTTKATPRKHIPGDIANEPCKYCGNTGTNDNLRGGVECAGCGHPK